MNILFVSPKNSARAPMAAGLAKRILGPQINILSAGVTPSQVHPFAVAIMREIDVDISTFTSNAIKSEMLIDVDFVVFVCGRKPTIKLSPKTKVFHWPIPDPEDDAESDETQMSYFRDTRNALNFHIKSMAKIVENHSVNHIN